MCDFYAEFVNVVEIVKVLNNTMIYNNNNKIMINIILMETYKCARSRHKPICVEEKEKE